MFLLKEAQNCRRQARSFEGKPEAPFLLKIARAFEELAEKKGVCEPFVEDDRNRAH